MNFFLGKNFQKKNHQIICAYWNIFDNMTAQWSTKGCYMNNITEYSVSCMCDHLTHFAVLMVWKKTDFVCLMNLFSLKDIEQKTTPRFVEQILSIITLIGLLLSSVGLCLTILTFIFFK